MARMQIRKQEKRKRLLGFPQVSRNHTTKRSSLCAVMGRSFRSVVVVLAASLGATNHFVVEGFSSPSCLPFTAPSFGSSRSSALRQSPNNANYDTATTPTTAALDATTRLPTSVDDQVRQAVVSLQRASQDGRHRHVIRLLLPVIGATDLDDWPGGARQMMEAAYPLVTSIVQGIPNSAVQCSNQLVDASEGVYAIMAQAARAKDDACAVVLPTADLVLPKLQELSDQVGPTRNLLLVNPQWKRRSDFPPPSGASGWSSWFSGKSENNDPSLSPARYIESTYEPTFSLTNLIVEGENIRILRTYPGPWRVFVRREEQQGEGLDPVVDWVQVGEQAFVPTKPNDWEEQPVNQRDGGQLFSFGMPSYQEIVQMLNQSPNYVPKNPAERAMAAFNFIKDTL